MGQNYLSFTVAVILQALDNGYQYGFDIMDITGLPSGTVYPALRRLEESGYVESKWEKHAIAQAAQRPRTCTSATSFCTTSPRSVTAFSARQTTPPQSLQTKCGCCACSEVPPGSPYRHAWSPSQTRTRIPTSARAIRFR